jgi:quercetin dioxygenase-like cupin family protein
MKRSLVFVVPVITLTAAGPLPTSTVQEEPDWLAFELDDIREERARHGRPWQEFIRVPDLFAGLYEIPAGGEDRQSPHDFDEVYHVLQGKAVLTVEEDRIAVGPGSVVYVAKQKEHRFVEIEEDLSVLVFFATPGDG